MKVAILTQFSRGDVQPFGALAKALKSAGHEVVVGVPEASAALVEPHSDRVIPFVDIAKKLIADPVIRKSLDANYRGLRGKVLAAEHLRRRRILVASLLDDLTTVIRERPDLVVHHSLLPGNEVAERLGVPAVPVCLAPVFVPTSAFPSPLVPLRMPPALNRVSYRWTASALRPVAAKHHRRWRRQSLGLPNRRYHRDVLRRPDGGPATVLQAFSRHALPGPLNQPEWVHTTGFWFLPVECERTMPAELDAFIKAGEPPIYVGFGSMSGTDPSRSGQIIAEAIQQADVRAVVAGGWGGIALHEHSDRMLLIEQAPHDLLFPRMAAVVHHGGAGTTAAALAAGRPQVICPFIADQRYWAGRARALGVSSDPLPQHRLNARNLAAAIRQAVRDTAMAGRAARLGERIRTEDGVTTAVKVLESLA